MPLIHGRQTKKDFDRIIDRVRTKLSSWKANYLSMAGRVTLTSFVISSMPYYAMQSTRIPILVCNEIEKVQRNFIWGHLIGPKKVHSASWDMVCGGLGIKNFKV